MTYKVRAGDGIASNDCGADARHKFFAGDDLLPHQMPAALSLHLILNVACGEAGTNVLLHGTRDHGGSTETIIRSSQIEKAELPQIARTQCLHQR